MTRFCHNQHVILARRLIHISQTTTVVDYVSQFSALMDRIAAYELNPDPVHYTTKFIDGLQPGVRILVAIQQTRDLDTAYSLALLYEELGEECVPPLSPAPQHVPVRRNYQSSVTATPPPPPPPACWVSQKVEEKRQAENHRSAADDKWQSLRAYRRSKNLCFTCGEKYHREHRCKNAVQLHVVQEMVEYMQSLDSKEPDAVAPEEQEPDPHLMMLSIAALNTTVVGPKTMLLKVHIQDQEFLFLVDSRSSSCFIDSNKDQALTGSVPLANSIQVKGAGGALLPYAQ
jgi:hypothetical protein